MDALTLSGIPIWLIVVTVLWSLPWKAYGLWKSAQLSHKWWFIAIFVVNSFGLLEMYYLYFVAQKYTVEIKGE